ncbi:DUF1905 domain-containing protein [Aeromicrobium phragmitis]|uniref:DUF1905 domain-containing protein n=1 Tax=Aeromicrobium phragmitis TaxID=2478914 RepID=A0A3L8PP07_9ACTN|nr:DUF1905 domain-containing protein [Aeromicrobium phragmitis]RLV57111.1 DUF1905 domain-containing protein [Aeromicrobium phragmitis]
MTPAFAPIAHDFEVPLRRDDTKGAWTIAVLPASGELLGTRRPVKVSGLLDGHRFEATLLPMGDGTHMLPVKADLRKRVGKGDGDLVRIHLDGRTS